MTSQAFSTSFETKASPPPASSEEHFFNAVMAAGGNISRTPRATSSKASTTPTSNEADISVNEDMFLPSIAAAAAVTLSPSFGPSSLPDDFKFPTTDDFLGNWQRGSSATSNSNSSGNGGGKDSHLLLPSLETVDEYQLRMAMMNGMSLGPSATASSVPGAMPRTLPSQQHHQHQPHQSQHQPRYETNYMYYDQPTAASSAYGGVFPAATTTSSSASSNPHQAFRYDQNAYVSSQRMMDQRYQQQSPPLQQHPHMMYYQQQQQQQQHAFLDYGQQNPYSSRVASSNSSSVAMGGRSVRGGGAGGRQQQQQQIPSWSSYDDVYSQQQLHAIPAQPPRSTLVEELRAAIRASNSMTMSSGSGPGGGGGGGRQPPSQQQQQQRSRPGYMPPQHQQQQQQINNAMLMANQAPLVNIPFTLADIRGHAVELAQDQYGSRWLQQQLCSLSVSAADKQRLFAELLPASLSLASDTFGNYCVQILLNPAVGTPEQQRQLCTRAFEGNIVELSRNTYACRCIQSLVKLFQLGDTVIPLYLQDKMLRELEPEILVLVTDSNANHVCQQVIERIRPIQRIEFILNAFKGNYVQLAKDPFGCRVCQRVLEHATEEFVEPALEELLEQMDNLVTDSMGNYVVQHIITAYSGDRYLKQRTRLVNCVKSKLLQFATHKFASNVVEKVLEYGDPTTRREIIQMMLDPPPGGGVSMLQIMMSDLFANYVCQRSLAVADRDQLVRLVQVVRQNANELRRMTYGKHILAACDKAALAAGIQ